MAGILLNEHPSQLNDLSFFNFAQTVIRILLMFVVLGCRQNHRLIDFTLVLQFLAIEGLDQQLGAFNYARRLVIHAHQVRASFVLRVLQVLSLSLLKRQT